MAISAKAVSVCIVKFLRLSMKYMCRYAKKYPLPSATLFIIFILHLFFPFAFIFLVFSVPFFLFGYIMYRRFVPSSSKPKPKTIKPSSSIKLESVEDAEVKYRDINSQITKRRNVKSSIDDTNRQEDVKRVKFCISPDDDDDDDDYNTVEQKEKVEERDKDVVDEPLKEEAEETEEIEEDEDDAQEDGFGDKIVEWTEDDQKNLMEVGFSELEKNLTLENLIAKRNAGKFSMSPRASETIVPHVSVTRINPFDEIPGTAPSFFSRNPFDLPSEGSGGVHNVKFDSFEQDLMGADRNKDKLCRHHSFTRGTSFSAENLRNQESRMLGIFSCMERILAGESMSDKGDHDRFIEQLLYQDQGSEAGSSPSSAKLGGQVIEETAKSPSEIRASLGSIQTEHTKDPSSREEGSRGTLLSSSKSEELNEISNVKENNENASVNGTLEKDNQTLLNDYVNRNVAHHHSMRSVASDLQVEVSEPASPRTASSTWDLQSFVSEGELDGIKLESQGQIRSSTKPKEAAVHSVDNSDSMAYSHSGKPQVKLLDIKEGGMNISISTSRNVGDNANMDTVTEEKEKLKSPTQQVILEPKAPIEDMKSEVMQGSHEQSGGASLEQVKSEPVEKIREESGASEVRTT